jgi:hypothetical protein
LTGSLELYFAKSTNYETPLITLPLSVQQSPQHPVLKHPQSLLLPYSQTSSFTCIHFRRQKRRQKFLDWLIASIIRIQSPNFLLNKFWFFTVVHKYLNCVTFSKHLLPIFISWFCPAYWWWDSSIYLFFSVFISRPTSLLASIIHGTYVIAQ